MLRNILLPTILALFSYGFWLSPDFKEISAGVAIFLFGMLFLEEGFKAFTGGVLEQLLARTTSGRLRSLAFGVVTTAVMQSSSLVSVITISFLSAGLIDLAAGIGILFGANLGTTTGAWLIAGFGMKVKISAYAMPMLVFGVVLVFQRSRYLKGIGHVLGGVGFLFLGIHHMKTGFEAFREVIDLQNLGGEGLFGVLLYLAVGALATVVMQSSHATLVLIITGLAAGQIGYQDSLALAIGANIGTTVTAVLGSLSAGVAGKRLALAHLLFNGVTAVLAVVFLGQLGQAVDVLSDSAGIADDDFTLRLAVFHTLFNGLGVVVMTPLIGSLERLLLWGLPEGVGEVAAPRYLVPSVRELPDTAIEAVRKETRHLYENTFQIIVRALSLLPKDIRSDHELSWVVGRTTKIEEVDVDAEYETQVKGLYGAIVAFVSEAQISMNAEQSDEMFALRTAGRALVESIKDVKHMRKNLARFLSAPNQDIRAEYDRLRTQLASVLRLLEEAREEAHEEGEGGVLSLDAIKLEMEESDSTRNGRLEQLIRQRRITTEMATSLMNDAGYTYDACKNLVRAGTVLFATGDLASRQAERNLALDADEIDELTDQEPDQEQDGTTEEVGERDAE